MKYSGNLLGNSAMPNYIKICAAGILTSTYLAALAVAFHDSLSGVPLPSDISFILGTGLSLAVSALGMHQGAQLSESGSLAGNLGGNTNASTPTP